MVRSFSDGPIPGTVLDRLFADALRAPSAGNTKGSAWILLEGAEQTARYWDTVTTPDWRRRSRRWPGLSRAPVVAVSLTSPRAYVERYREPDKRGELGGGEDAWPVPYWWADAAFGVMTLLLGAAAEGLGACFLGNFRGEGALLAELGVPEGWRLFGAVVLGRPDGGDAPSPSLARRAPGESGRLHRGRW
jgi:nitroreductase